MSKLNNSHILLALLLLMIFIIFFSLSIVLIVQPYFCNLEYVGIYKSNEYGFPRKIIITFKFEEYGRFIATSTETSNGHRGSTYSETGTYEYTTRYEDKPYFNLESYWSSIHCRNAFILEYSDVVFTNIGAICLLIFYLLMSVGSLACAIILLKRRQNGKKIFYNVARMQAQIDELQNQVEELKKEE